MQKTMKLTVSGLLVLAISVILFSFPSMGAGCDISISGIVSQSPDNNWPYWADGNYTASISFSAPSNTTFYSFSSGLSVWVVVDSNSSKTSWSGINESYWRLCGGCSPLDITGWPYLGYELPSNPFDWRIGYLSEGKCKLEVGLYCEYIKDNETHNCSSFAENVFTVSQGASGGGGLQADFTWEPSNPTIFDPVDFQSNSRVTVGYITEYHWFLDGEYLSTVAGLDSWEWTNPVEGSHTVNLTVVDSNGNLDSIEFTLEISADEWFIIDKATCKYVQQWSPWDSIDVTNSFQYGDNIYAWFKLGNVTAAHNVEFVWSSPSFSTVRSFSKTIVDPSLEGYSMWESCAMWDNISMGDSLYENVFSQPGEWMVCVYIDGKQEMILNFNIASDLKLEVSIDKSKYITGESAFLQGSVTINNMPVIDVKVEVQIYRENVLIETLSEISTGSNGGFSVYYTIPVVSFSEDSVEDWFFKVSSELQQSTYSTISESVSFQVLPVHLELVDVKMVQIVEVPVLTDLGGSYPYFVAGRPAGIRVILRCPGWEEGFKYPEVTVSFAYRLTKGSTLAVMKEKTVAASISKTPVDFTFNLSSGGYTFNVVVDPYNEFSNPLTMSSYVDDLKWDESVISKKMKSLSLRFVPVDIPDIIECPSQIKFYKKQLDFIRDVYPIPQEDITFRCCYRYDTQPYERTKWTLLNMLATKNLLGNKGNNKVVLVGVTPDGWWKDADGMALVYITSAVIVKNDSSKNGAIGHEVGHTLGLHPWTEEYNWPNYPPYGKEVDGLIFKDGEIYNLSIKKDYFKAFFPGRNPMTDPDYKFYCMMGNTNENGFDMEWICKEDTKILFNSLRDPPNSQTVFVNGWINTDGTVRMDNCYLLSESVPDEPFDHGEYTIQVLSHNGNVLYSDDFGSKAEQDMPFAFRIPWYTDAYSVNVKQGNLVLATVALSAHTPNVEILEPLGGEYFNDKFTVSWQGSDIDEDQLSYSVLYSHDGEYWEVIDVELENTSVTLNTSRLPGGSECMVKVIATDGLNIGYAQSSYFAVEKKQPICAIINEDDGSISGVSYDLEDGLLSSSKLNWYSDTQGYIGTGEILDQNVLNIGDHEITLIAGDSDGNKAEDATMVSITQSTCSNFEHVFCRGVDDYGNPMDVDTVFSTHESVYSFLTLDDAVVGDEVTWTFKGPGDITQYFSLIVESSETIHFYASFDLSEYPPENVKGVWTTDVYINDVLISTDFFKVEDSSETPLGLSVVFLSLVIIVLWLRRKQ